MNASFHHAAKRVFAVLIVCLSTITVSAATKTITVDFNEINNSLPGTIQSAPVNFSAADVQFSAVNCRKYQNGDWGFELQKSNGYITFSMPYKLKSVSVKIFSSSSIYGALRFFAGDNIVVNSCSVGTVNTSFTIVEDLEDSYAAAGTVYKIANTSAYPVRLASISFGVDMKDESGIAFTSDRFETRIDNPSLEDIFVNPNGLSVQFQSSNSDVAEMTADGKLVISHPGTTVLTASTEETDLYAAGEAKCVLIVRSMATGGNPYYGYECISSEDELTVGEKYIIISGPNNYLNNQFGPSVMTDKKLGNAAKFEGFEGAFIYEDDATALPDHIRIPEDVSPLIITMKNIEGKWYAHTDMGYLTASGNSYISCVDAPTAQSVVTVDMADAKHALKVGNVNAVLALSKPTSTTKSMEFKFVASESKTYYPTILCRSKYFSLCSPEVKADGATPHYDMQKGCWTINTIEDVTLTLGAVDEDAAVWYHISDTGKSEVAAREESVYKLYTEPITIPAKSRKTVTFYSKANNDDLRSDIETLMVDLPTDIETPWDNSASEIFYYDLMGRRLTGPVQGIVIRVRDGRAEKLRYGSAD